MNLRLPLGSRPILAACGLAEHGLRGREQYLLPKLWCLHLYFYEVTLEVDGVRFPIVPGAVTLIPPGRRLVYEYGSRRCRHFYVHFGLAGREPAAEAPMFQHLPEARDELLDRLQHLQAVSTRNKFHAEILLWSLLWDVAAAAGRRADDPRRDLPERIDEAIEESLPGRITVASLAEKLGFSPAHINRIVKARHGCTAVQLLRKRRLQRACHLLLHSTMPVKLIAAESGLESLQQFNKLVRKEYGEGPRALRERALNQPEDDSWVLNRR